MGLFGRTACRENRDWELVVFFNNERSCTVTEQLNEKEAKKFYFELKKELEDSKSDWVEIETDNGDDYENDTRLFNKRNITHIKLQDN